MQLQKKVVALSLSKQKQRNMSNIQQLQAAIPNANLAGHTEASAAEILEMFKNF